MSAPPYEQDLPSISSSGHTDGLGRRVLAFDRESGALLDRLHLRPEFAAFQSGIAGRIQDLAPLVDAHFATTGVIDRDAATGEVIVVSEFISGTRLSDLLDLAQDSGIVPGLDAALGYLLDALEGLAVLHESCAVAHGLIDPSRTVLTPDGRVVFLDPAYGAVVERLGLSPHRLWTTFGVAVPPGRTPVRLGPAVDVSQAALSAVTLILGRSFAPADYPDRLPALLAEVSEVAQIRGTEACSASLERFFRRALPLQDDEPYVSASEALADLRDMVGTHLGIETCRTALLEFIAQTAGAVPGLPPSFPGAVDDEAVDEEIFEDTEFEDTAFEPGAAASPNEPAAGTWSEDVEAPASDEEPEPLHAAAVDRQYDDDEEPDDSAQEDDGPLEFDLQLDPEGPSHSRRGSGDANVFELSPADLDASILDTLGLQLKVPPRPEPPPFVVMPDPEPSVDEPAAEATIGPPQPADGTPPAQPAGGEAAPAETSQAPGRGGSRRKRQEKKSARARKDKLRSTLPVSSSRDADAQEAPAPTAASAASTPKPADGAADTRGPGAQPGWLVPPDKAAAFEIPGALSSPPPVTPVRPPVPSFAPPPPSPVAPAASVPIATYPPPPPVAPAPVTAAPVTPGPIPPPQPQFGVPAAKPQPSVAASGTVSPAGVAAQTIDAGVTRLAPVKLKTEPPDGFTPARRKRSQPVAAAAGPAVAPLPGAAIPGVLPLPHGPHFGNAPEPSRFPMKLAVAALVLVGLGIAGARYMLGGQQAVAAKAAAETDAAIAASVPGKSETAAKTGTIVAQTRPAGARVLLDGRAVGRTPARLEGVAPGRYVITFESSSGSVRRQIRVAAGETLELDVPVFSGWVAVYAPIQLSVSEGNRLLGTTDDGKVMLAPGTHRLTLANPALGYRTQQTVEVVAGETATLRLEPTGQANLNAVPWAEVWMDGRRLGETPLAGVPLPLGSHELIFKHPKLGDRHVTAVIRGNQTTAISVDFARP